jgi:hypothetical protein
MVYAGENQRVEQESRNAAARTAGLSTAGHRITYLVAAWK